MKAVVYRGPWEMALEDLPRPEPGPGEVLLRMSAVGICGSDVHGFTGQSGRRAPGMVMGHEAVGVVEAQGSGVERPAIGETVAVYNIIDDSRPPEPGEGDPSFLDKKVVGVNLARRGAMAEYLALPADNALPVPEGLDDPELGVLVEPLAVVAHGFDRLARRNIVPGRVAVVGAGTIGLAAILVARRRGAGALAAIDPVVGKRERAVAFGAHAFSPGEGVAGMVEDALEGPPDLVVDAAGTGNSFARCLACVRTGGSVLLIGNLARELRFPLQDVVGREITLVGTYGFDRAAFASALESVPDLQESLSFLVEGRCSLEEVPRTMTRLARGELQALKVVIRPG